MKYLLGIDIGGTKVAYQVLNQQYKTLKQKVFNTQQLGGGTSKFVDSLVSIIATEDLKQIKKIGIAINAAVYNNKILKSSVLNTENYPLAEYLKNKFNIDVSVENDVIAFAKAELKLGYGKKIKNFAVLNIGTGTHVTYCQNGTLLTGYRNVAGEISQIKLYIKEFNKIFLLDDFISGRGLKNIYSELTGKEKEAVEIFHDKDIFSIQTIEIFKKYLISLFENISYFYNPDVIVLTGSLFKSSDKFLYTVLKEFNKTNFNFFTFTIVHSKLKNGYIIGSLL